MDIVQLECELPEWSEILFRRQRYKTIYGGRGAGRSWSVARVLLALAAQKPIRILCARELQRSIADSVHRLLSDQIQALGLVGYTITQRTIEHANGSAFLFEGLCYNIAKIKSMEGIDICWVEEAEKVSKDSWDVLIPTIRKDGSEIWITFNPDLEEDPTYQRFVLNPPPGSEGLQVSWRDNPWFPETLREEKDYLYRVDPEAADWVWGGNCRKASDAQILRGKWSVDYIEPDPANKTTWMGPYYGLDFGFAHDPTAMMEVWIRKNIQRKTSTLVIRREAYKVGLETDHMIKFFKENLPNTYLMQMTVRADSARPETISYLRRGGMRRIEGVMKWNGSIEDGIAYLRQFEEIIIHPDCPYTAQEAKLWSYKVDRLTGDVLTLVVDRHNNTWDAVRYALAPLIRASRRHKTGYSGRSYQGS